MQEAWRLKPGKKAPRFSVYFAPRWRKTVRDLAVRPGRTFLVVLSIAVGVMALGTVIGTRQVLERDLDASFEAIRPASGSLQTLEPFDEDLIRSVQAMPEIEAAEGRRNVPIRVEVAEDDFRNVQLISVPDFERMSLDKIIPDHGEWPPPKHAMLVERSALRLLSAKVGDTVSVRTSGGKERRMRIAGTAFDVYALPYTLDGIAWAYVTEETLAWLGEPREFNALHVSVAEGKDNKAHIQDVMDEVRDKVERGGRAILLMTVPEPGRHPLGGTIDAMLTVLSAMGLLSLLLSALLVTNTVSALMSQEQRYIGVMKAIGASRPAIRRMYQLSVLVFGGLAFFIALPLAFLGARSLAGLMAGYLNLDADINSLPISALLTMAFVTLLVPSLAAIIPIMRGTGVSVRQAISDYGLGASGFGASRLDRMLDRMRGVPRTWRMPMRNTLRRKARTALTLLTLTMAGAMFMAVMSVNSSVQRTLDDLLSTWQYDLAVQLDRPYRVERLRQLALSNEGIVEAEGWSFTTAQHLSAENKQRRSMMAFSVPMIIFVPPADSKMIRPPIIRGRWLRSGDESAVVVTPKILEDQPGLDIGGTIRLKVQGRESDWTVVGVVTGIGPAPIAYAAYEHFSRVVRETGHAQFLAMITSEHTLEAQNVAAEKIESSFGDRGVRVSLMSKIQEERAEASAIFAGIIALLLSMVLIMALVGGLGMTGTMSLNVIERTREIGVMRSIGASGRAIFQLFMIEGLILAWLSWGIAVLLSLPLGAFISRGVGDALLGTPMRYAPPVLGAAIWLAMVSILAVLASLIPARNASKITVREALAYE